MTEHALRLSLTLAYARHASVGHGSHVITSRDMKAAGQLAAWSVKRLVGFAIQHVGQSEWDSYLKQIESVLGEYGAEGCSQATLYRRVTRHEGFRLKSALEQLQIAKRVRVWMEKGRPRYALKGRYDPT